MGQVGYTKSRDGNKGIGPGNKLYLWFERSPPTEWDRYVLHVGADHTTQIRIEPKIGIERKARLHMECVIAASNWHRRNLEDTG